jgi:DNA gyrase/topoisomerase IV subunit B
MQYPIIHLLGDDIEIALTHSKSQYSEEYHSFVNGQNTTQGGTHLGAFVKLLSKPSKSFTTKVLKLQTFVNQLCLRFPSKWKNQFSNRKPKPN